jgi:CRP/FNR family cyclic AMP-dependent transcriptional regulator
MMPTDPSFLQKFPCFRDLSDDQREAIAQLATAICFPRGHVLFEEGKPGDHLYLLASGKVEVLYDISEEEPTQVDLVSGEEVIGCSVLVPPFTYTASARCLSEVEVLELDAEALRKLMREDCPLGFSIQQYILRTLIDRIVDFRLEI